MMMVKGFSTAVRHYGRKAAKELYLLKGEKGIAIPLVLIVLVVLALLGTALWQYSASELNQAVYEENKARAYYIARAGAESLARYLMQFPEQVETILGEDSEKISELFTFETDHAGNVGEMEVGLKRLGSDRLEVTGIGTVEGIQQEVSIILEARPFFGDAAVITTSSELVNFHKNMTVEGNIIAGGEINLPDNFDYSKYRVTENYPFTDDTFVRVVIPTGPDFVQYNKISIKNKETYEINAGSKIRVNELDNKGTLIIHTAKDVETILVVNKLNMQANCEMLIEGDGLADVYVESLANIQTQHTSVKSDARLTFYLAEGCEMTLQANSDTEALIYGPHNATVIMQGSATFRGAMIVSTLRGLGTFIGQKGLIEFLRGFADDDMKPVINLLYWVQ